MKTTEAEEVIDHDTTGDDRLWHCFPFKGQAALCGVPNKNPAKRGHKYPLGTACVICEALSKYRGLWE